MLQEEKSISGNTFSQQLEKVINLLSKMIAVLKEEKCPDLSEIEICFNELRNLHTLYQTIQSNLLAPLLKDLDNFLSIDVHDGKYDGDINEIRNKAIALREKFQQIRPSEVNSSQSDLKIFQQIYSAVIQDDLTIQRNILTELQTHLSWNTLLRIAQKIYFVGKEDGIKEAQQEKIQQVAEKSSAENEIAIEGTREYSFDNEMPVAENESPDEISLVMYQQNIYRRDWLQWIVSKKQTMYFELIAIMTHLPLFNVDVLVGIYEIYKTKEKSIHQKINKFLSELFNYGVVGKFKHSQRTDYCFSQEALVDIPCLSISLAKSSFSATRLNLNEKSKDGLHNTGFARLQEEFKNGNSYPIFTLDRQQIYNCNLAILICYLGVKLHLNKIDTISWTNERFYICNRKTSGEEYWYAILSSCQFQDKNKFDAEGIPETDGLIIVKNSKEDNPHLNELFESHILASRDIYLCGHGVNKLEKWENGVGWISVERLEAYQTITSGENLSTQIPSTVIKAKDPLHEISTADNGKISNEEKVESTFFSVDASDKKNIYFEEEVESPIVNTAEDVKFEDEEQEQKSSEADLPAEYIPNFNSGDEPPDLPDYVKHMSVREYAASLLSMDDFSPEKNYPEVLTLIYKVLSENSYTVYDKTKDQCCSSVGNALLLCHTFALSEKSNNGVYHDFLKKLSYAIDYSITGENNVYSGYNFSQIFDKSVIPCAEYLKIAALMRTLFAPETSGDYDLRTYAENFSKVSGIWEKIPEVKKVFELLRQMHKDSPNKGFSPQITNAILNGHNQDKILNDLAKRAEELRAPTSLRQTKRPEFTEELFGDNNIISMALQIVKEKKISERAFVKDVLDEMKYTDQVELSAVINKMIQDAWDKPGKSKVRGGWVVEQSARPLIARIKLLAQWYEATGDIDALALNSLKKLHNQLLSQIDKALNALKASHGPQKTILSHILSFFAKRLKGEANNNRLLFAPVLHTGAFILDEKLNPRVDEFQFFCEYFEPWRNALYHISREITTLADIENQITNPNVPHENSVFDNLMTQILIKSLREDSLPTFPTPEAVKQAQKSIADDFKDYIAKIEFAYTRGQIGEIEKEEMLEYLRELSEKDDCFEFGYLRRFLASITKRIKKSAAIRKEKYLERISAVTEKIKLLGHSRKLELLGKASKLLNDGDYEVAEEYINKCESDWDQDIEIWDEDCSDLEILNEFIHISPNILEVCGKTDAGILKAMDIERFFPEGSSNRKNSETLITEWQSIFSTKSDKTSPLKNLFEKFGFAVSQVKSSKTRNSSFKLNLIPLAKHLLHYKTPFACFGTMPEEMDVLVIPQKMEAEAMGRLIYGTNLTKTSFILWDKSINLQTRRKIVEYLRDKQDRKTCLLIDRVLMTFLASKTNDRLPALLQCTLPFTYLQPFTPTGFVSDEMFRGRTEYLKIITETGSSRLLYGGRQLGKTAILQRAANMEHKPEEKRFAVYVSVYDIKSEEDFTISLTKALRVIRFRSNPKTLKDFADELEQKINDQEIERLLLLVDEADSFLNCCAPNDYRLLAPLVNLGRNTNNKFKFILAGLHNVVKAGKASANNSPLGQLEPPLCVKPFTSLEARQLLQIPLNHLGFSFEEKEKLELILSKSNYYPGILHFSGQKILETITDRYCNYYSAGANPPCSLKEEHLQAVIANQGMNEAIKEKLSLTLDLDYRYRLLAYCVAWNYYNDPEQRRNGSTLVNIQESGALLDMNFIECLSKLELSALLEEMAEMAILQKVGENRFRLRKYSFVELLGKNSDEIEHNISEALKNI